jgi:small subunit ribosomal protein S5
MSVAKAMKEPKIDGQYEERLIKVRRTTKVVKGGKIFGFAALVVVGNRNGRVGIGFGKAREVPEAIRKAMDHARRNLVEISLNGATIHHMIVANHGASKVFMKPASVGTGIIAGGSMRPIFELAGVKDVLSKVYGSSNAINVARATIKALTHVNSPQAIAEKRGKSLEEITGESANV